jgi:ribosomal protein S18 acetylase RimI-like enzyme
VDSFRIRDTRPADAAAIARVHVDTWRTAYRGIVSDEHLRSLSYESAAKRVGERLSRQAETGFISLVAVWEDGEIVGFAEAGAERKGVPGFDGEIYGIYVLEAYQGKGIGRALVGGAARELARAGFSSAILWVLEANAARGFYEALGGASIKTDTVSIGGEELPVVSYGWPDLTSLADL